MFKKIIRFMVFFTLWLINPQVTIATSHHSGHGGGNGGGGGNAGGIGCPKISVKNIKPEPLSELASGSEFTALVYGAKSEHDIVITAKELPVKFTAVDREIFLAIKAKLPEELHNTPARINVKVSTNAVGCDEASGWLYKIK